MKAALISILMLIMQTILHAQVSALDYLNYAKLFTESKKHDEAIKVCDKLLILRPGNADVYYLRGINKYLLNDYEGAIKDFDTTLNLQPGYSDALLFRAKTKKANKDLLGALRDYSRVKDEDLYSTVKSLAGDFIQSLFSK